ncbi:hypothetical protein M91_17754 [Bos mutus]|uniref:Uncharacterized protein n=1 Tax=Bos mutus TaxID=72004 RepID=L8IVA3_9CETA|nr:hypothetical protein M91_17754 [Bos mutus]
MGAGLADYSYRSLKQDPEPEGAELATVVLGLHSPDRPVESKDEDEEGATALSDHNTAMDPEHGKVGGKGKGGDIKRQMGIAMEEHGDKMDTLATANNENKNHPFSKCDCECFL